MINILVLISLFAFYVLFIGRTIILYRHGIKVWVIGTSSKKFIEKILENLSIPMLIMWSILIVVAAFNITMPGILSKLLLNIYWIKYIGILFC